MITSSGNLKNPKAIQTRNGRHILGEFIKGKLEGKGSLKKFEQITSSTLDHYGRDYVNLLQISDKEYIMDF